MLRAFLACLQAFLPNVASELFRWTDMSKMFLEEQDSEIQPTSWPTGLYDRELVGEWLAEYILSIWPSPKRVETNRQPSYKDLSMYATLNDIVLPLLRYKLETHCFYSTDYGTYGLSPVPLLSGDLVAVQSSTDAWLPNWVQYQRRIDNNARIERISRDNTSPERWFLRVDGSHKQDSARDEGYLTVGIGYREGLRCWKKEAGSRSIFDKFHKSRGPRALSVAIDYSVVNAPRERWGASRVFGD
jgi:hypothetical protein